MEKEQHPHDPAEGPDEGERQNEGEHQNEERELHDGDEVTEPGGKEPPD